MKKTFLLLSISFLVIIAFISCNNHASKNKKEIEHITAEEEQAMLASPPAIIYKTKANYDTLVPVILSKEKDRVVSYPDIKGLMYEGKLAYPTRLANGFLLDNRGITERVAFLDISFKDYKNLDKTPKPTELFEMIIDKDPLESMYFCGSKSLYKELVKELNEKIIAEDFSQWSKLK